MKKYNYTKTLLVIHKKNKFKKYRNRFLIKLTNKFYCFQQNKLKNNQ